MRAALLLGTSAALALTALVAWGGGGDRAELESSGLRLQKLDLNADFWPKTGTCDGMRAGARQSPVAIVEAEGGNVEKVLAPAWGWVLNHQGGLFRLKSPGTRQATGAAGQDIFVSGNTYDCREVGASLHYRGHEYALESFALKTPSEHTVNGMRFAMEQQFRHALKGPSPFVGHIGDLGDAAGGSGETPPPPATLMVSVLFSTDPLESPTYVDKLYHGLDCLREGMHCQQAFSFAAMARTILFQTREAAQWWKTTYDFNWMDTCLSPPCIYGGRHGDHVIPLYLAPDAKANLNNYFRYEGSLTEPPCTEGVEWLVLKNALPIAQDHAEEFRRTLGDIARPLQPDQGRVVQEVEPRGFA